MTKSFWKPERRNRKIGTAAAGYSQTNKMTIPESLIDRFGNLSRYYERANPDYVKEYVISGKTITVLYEKPAKGFSYGCSPPDVIHLVSRLPVKIYTGLDLVVFRQPTKKQSQQNPVWGRLIYDAEISIHTGVAIILDAQELGAKLCWPRKISMEDRVELDRLKADGHQFEKTKRGYFARLCEPALRNTILYRTLLHELGHLKHYEINVRQDGTALSKEPERAWELFKAKPSSEREIYAHNFAENLARNLQQDGHIPFAPIGFNPSS